MKKTININFQGQLITIEETAYDILNQYLQSLKEYFRSETEGREIVNDIENRIAELFGNRLKHGIACITDEDVISVINTIGRPEEFDTEFEERQSGQTTPPPIPPHDDPSQQMPPPVADPPRKSLYRKSNDKILGGVCSGLAHYLKIDPVFVRLGFVLLFSLLFWVYIILWIVLPKCHLPSNLKKRLYRNPNDRFIGGVCGGIAAYFRIDTWIPRIIFLLPILFNMVGLIRIPLFAFNQMFYDFSSVFNLSSGINFSFVTLYIILWIIMPKAVTVKQKLEMMGEEDYLRSIRSTMGHKVANARISSSESKAAATDNIDPKTDTTSANDQQVSSNPRQSLDDEVNRRATPPPPHTDMSYYYAQSEPQQSGCLQFIVGFFKVVFFGIVGIVAASIIFSLLNLIFVGVKFAPLQSLFINSGFENMLLWITVLLVLVVPFLALIVWIFRRIMKAKSRPIISAFVVGLWFIGVFGGLLLGYNMINKFSTEAYQETDIMLASPTNDKLYVEMENYPEDYIRIAPQTDRFFIGSAIINGVEMDNLPCFNLQEDSLLYSTIEFDIKSSKDSMFHAKTIYASLGKNYKSAKSNVRDFNFVLEQEDSLLFIPQFFKVPKSQGFRNQSIKVEIYVPSGSKLELGDNLRRVKFGN